MDTQAGATLIRWSAPAILTAQPDTPMKTRTERDTFGPVEVPAQRLWGAQTQRSLQNFDISGERQPREIIRALTQVKRCCGGGEPPDGPVAAGQGVGHHRRRRRGARRPARRGISPGGVADRLGHPDQHERQRGAGQPRQRVAGRPTRRGSPGASERRRQHEPVVQRRVSHGDERGGGGRHPQPAAAFVDQAQVHAGRQVGCL